MCNLNDPRFHDDTKAREYLEATLWPKGPVCPHCGTIGTAYVTSKPGLYRCAEKLCRKDFTVTVGTVFERSKIALHKWLLAAFLICSSKKGMSAHQLHRTLGVTYKTAWFMAHRLREAMKSNPGGLMGGGGKIVEADETFWGTEPGKKKAHSGFGHKMKIMSLVERGASVRSFVITDLKLPTVKAVLDANVDKASHLMTDEGIHYYKAGQEFAKYSTVAHGMKEYARGEVTTNTIEGFFSILKRGLIGTYHHVGSQHLQRYMSEFDFRYNNRAKLGVNDLERTTLALKGIAGKRLTYRRPGSQQTN